MSKVKFVFRAILLYIIGDILFIMVLSMTELIWLRTISNIAKSLWQLALDNSKIYWLQYSVIFFVMYILDYFYKRYVIKSLNKKLDKARCKK